MNGEQEIIEQETLTISELLVIKKVKMPEMVSVERNGEMVDREKFGATDLKEDDEVEFLYFMGGGEDKG